MLGLVLDYFVSYHVCRVDSKRLSSWPHSCARRSNHLSWVVVLSRSTFHLVCCAICFYSAMKNVSQMTFFELDVKPELMV